MVRRVDTEKSSIRVKHDAIPEWRLSAMTMNMDVSDPELLDHVVEGSEVVLEIDRRGPSEYVVVAIDVK